MDLVVGLNTHDSLADIEAVRMPFTRFPLAYPGAFDALDAQSITLTAKHARAGGQAMPQTPAGTPQSALQSTFDGRAATMTSLQALPWIAGALRGLQAHGSAAKACWRQGGREIRCHRCPVASQAHQWCGAPFFCSIAALLMLTSSVRRTVWSIILLPPLTLLQLRCTLTPITLNAPTPVPNKVMTVPNKVMTDASMGGGW
jgi:hypothetical protein